MRQNIKTHTGNRIAVLLDGKQIGAMRSIRGNFDLSPETVSGIGDINAYEHTPTLARHSLSVSQMVLKKQNLMDVGIATENGEAALRGLVFDVEIFDKDNGRSLRKWTGVSYASGDIDVNAHQIIVMSGQFNAIDATGSF